MKLKKIICSSIVILLIACITIIVIQLLNKKEIETQKIAGITPILQTTTTTQNLTYQEPLTVVLEEEKEIETKLKNENKLEKELIEGKTQNLAYSQMETEIKNNESEKEPEEEKRDIQTLAELIATIAEKELARNKEEQQNAVEQVAVATQYNGFDTVGKIEIPKTGVDTPILSKVTVESMKNAPCLLYATGELNKSGNNLIVGHNFRNGTLFSDNKYLNLGDKIYITTLDGNRIEYTIYDKFVTTPEDVSYIRRDTNNKPEITLSCCTDDDENRIVLLAKII